MDKETNTKEKILNAIEGKLQITKVERINYIKRQEAYWDDGVYASCRFIYKGLSGSFEFNFVGGEYGLENLKYAGEDDIYDEITEWVEENIEFSMILKYDDKEL